MSGSTKRSADGDACLKAAEFIRCKMVALADRIAKSKKADLLPSEPLPVDDFLSEMVVRKNAPRIVLRPRKLGDELWTASLTAYVYAGIEQAFISAGILPGGNQSGHSNKLRELLVWIEKQETNPSTAVPCHFAQKTALLFSKGVLEERRPDRIRVIKDIAYKQPTSLSDLAQLKRWTQEDLSQELLRRKGRPADYQKITFAVEIARLWNRLTEQPISRGPKTNFARFVSVCWRSGFGDVDVNDSFKLPIRQHVMEEQPSQACGQCTGCRSSEACRRKSYFGILMQAFEDG